MAFGLVRIQVGAAHTHHRRDLQLVVELFGPRWNGHIVERSHDGRRVGEVEHGKLVPIGVHFQPSSLTGRPHVLLERVEVADRRRGRDRCAQLDGGDLEDLVGPRTNLLAGSLQPLTLVAQQVHETHPRVERVQGVTHGEPDPLSPLTVRERRPAHAPECSGASLLESCPARRQLACRSPCLRKRPRFRVRSRANSLSRRSPSSRSRNTRTSRHAASAAAKSAGTGAGVEAEWGTGIGGLDASWGRAPRTSITVAASRPPLWAASSADSGSAVRSRYCIQACGRPWSAATRSSIRCPRSAAKVSAADSLACSRSFSALSRSCSTDLGRAVGGGSGLAIPGTFARAASSFAGRQSPPADRRTVV